MDVFDEAVDEITVARAEERSNVKDVLEAMENDATVNTELFALLTRLRSEDAAEVLGSVNTLDANEKLNEESELAPEASEETALEASELSTDD